MKYTPLFLILIVGLVLFSSCSGETKDRSSVEYLSAYLKDNKNVMFFGKLDVNEIMEKAEYKQIPKVNVLLKQEMNQYKNALEMEQGIYFAVEGPFDQSGNPTSVIALARVKNMDSLVNKIGSMGMMMQKSGDMQFTQDQQMSVGVSEHLAVFMLRSEKYDAKASLAQVMKKCEDDLSSGKVEQILNQKGDITFGVSLENTYATSNTSLAKLEPSKKKELEALVADSYIQGSIQFNEGEALFQTENLFSNELMNRMMMNDDSEGKIISKLGTGRARVGISVNMDVKKIENFMKDFSPDYQQQLIGFSFIPFLSSKNGKVLSNIWNGQLAMVALGDLMQGGGLVPEVNFHVGLGDEGKKVSKDLLAMIPGTNDGKGTGSFNGIVYNISEREISGSTVKSTSASSKLQIPTFASGFGKKGITGFMDFTDLNLKSMGLEGGAKALYAVNYIYFEADNKGSRMILKGKQDKVNILKQVGNVFIKDIEEQVHEIN